MCEYIYKFSKSANDQIPNCRAYSIIQKLINGGKLSDGIDDGFDKFIHKDSNGNYKTRDGYDPTENDYLLFYELFHADAYQSGIIEQSGWAFNFRPFFKRYLVKTLTHGWREQYAPNEDFIKKCSVFPNEVLRIIEDKE